jgi:hypothetical protein
VDYYLDKPDAIKQLGVSENPALEGYIYEAMRNGDTD